jgi:hypothetical protein
MPAKARARRSSPQEAAEEDVSMQDAPSSAPAVDGGTEEADDENGEEVEAQRVKLVSKPLVLWVFVHYPC